MADFPIYDASSRLLTENSGTLPDMNSTIQGYFQPMSFGVLTKSVENYQNVETVVNTAFLGVWQPQTPEQLLLKPIGQRSWKWFMLHADPSLQLKTDDIVTYEGIQYRVMSRYDYSKYGYMQYELIDDYTGSGP